MNAAFAELLKWLASPISGNAEHSIDPLIAWHGRLMVAAWLIMIPASILIARFYKVTPRQDWPRVLDNPFWFIWHRRLAYCAIALMLFALFTSLYARKEAGLSANYHAIVGWGVVLLGCAQIINSLLRGTHGGPTDPFTRKTKPFGDWPGDHYCMTRRRVVFEYLHKTTGYTAVPMTLGACLTGLSLADAPRWMWFGAVSLFVVFAVAFIRLQRKGCCIDTYQAIWGLDPSLPGNLRRRAIGWGIRRR